MSDSSPVPRFFDSSAPWFPVAPIAFDRVVGASPLLSRSPRYDFKVIGVHKVVDGDTADLYVDVGFRAMLTQRVRLAHIDTPERTEVNYERAKLFLQDWLRERAGNLWVMTYLEDSFARWVGDIYEKTTGATASAALLEADLAILWTRR